MHEHFVKPLQYHDDQRWNGMRIFIRMLFYEGIAIDVYLIARCYGKSASISIVLLMAFTDGVIELFVCKFNRSEKNYNFHNI